MCVTGVITPHPPWNVDDVTRAMSKGGGGVLVNVQEWGCFSNFLDDVTRTMSKGGVLVKNPVSAPGPPPFQKSWIRPWAVYYIHDHKYDLVNFVSYNLPKKGAFHVGWVCSRHATLTLACGLCIEQYFK